MERQKGDAHPVIPKDKEEILSGVCMGLLPKFIREFIDLAPEELKDKPERHIKKALTEAIGRDHFEDMHMMRLLRINFWEEYDRAAKRREIMLWPNVTHNICHMQVAKRLLVNYPMFVLWIICPLSGYLLQRKQLEYIAQERLLEILSVSPVQENGKVDSRLAKVQVEIYQNIQDRLYGGIVQKIDQKQLNVNVNGDIPETDQSIKLMSSVEEIDRRIEAIKKKREALQSGNSNPIELDTQKLIQPMKIIDV